MQFLTISCHFYFYIVQSLLRVRMYILFKCWCVALSITNFKLTKGFSLASLQGFGDTGTGIPVCLRSNDEAVVLLTSSNTSHNNSKSSIAQQHQGVYASSGLQHRIPIAHDGGGSEQRQLQTSVLSSICHGGGGTLYSCSLCPLTTRDKNDFRKHMYVHTGERPYRCPWCVYRCRQSSNLMSHVKNIHPEHLDQYRNRRNNMNPRLNP